MSRDVLIVGRQADAASTNIIQYSPVVQAAAGGVTRPAAAGDPILGIIQQLADRDNMSVDVGVMGEFRAIAAGAIAEGDLVRANGTDGKVSSAIPTAAIVQSGADNDFTVTGKAPTYGRDDFSFEVRLNSTASAAAKFEVEGTHIIYYPATTTTPAITGTVDDMVTALAADAEALALIGITNTGADDGSGNMAAVATTPLTGGSGAFAKCTKAATADGDIVYIQMPI